MREAKLRPNRFIRSAGIFFTSIAGHTDTHTHRDTQTNCSENITPPRFRGGVITRDSSFFNPIQVLSQVVNWVGSFKRKVNKTHDCTSGPVFEVPELNNFLIDN